ncbi:MAG: Hsp70 family protein [Bacteroidales bacterium]|nr:Hsp70 family protein [Candidatus Cacconaster scatequi]
MVQVKMKYGIDLGTTNSAICKMENGTPTIKKADDLKDTMSSCVSFTRKKIIKLGTSAYNDLRQDKARATHKWTKDNENVFLEFKRTMGLDTRYSSSNMGREYNSEELSAEVLKTLKSFVSEDNINSCVITIPAKFTPDQIAATKRAATLAGINHCELLQEPIAASMAYGLTSSQKDGYWVVFDFGGGTFDSAVLKVEDGIMQVTDTEGDNYLGGKNLDYAIVDEIIIPYIKENFVIDDILADDTKRQILRDAMKFYAEQAKNQLSFKDKCDIMSQLDEFGDDDEGTPIELDMVITKEQLEPVVKPIFQKAVDITKELLKRNNLEGRLDTLILVGGPTYSPVLRSLLKDQITPNVDTTIDPMTAVAKGAALYASGIESNAVEEIKSGTVALDVQYNSSSVETLEFVTVKLVKEDSTGIIPNKVYVEFVRGDKAWSSGKIEINEIGDVIECQLNEGKANAFSIIAYDEKGTNIPCFPNEINIIQGTVVGSAILPRNIGIEVHDVDKSKDVFVPLKGLEKNKQLPAVGVRNGLKIPKKLRPGMSDDRLVIPIYIGESDAEGTSAIYNDHVFDVIITGDDVPALIPENSDIDITIKVDRSQLMTLQANFAVIGETIEKEIEVGARSEADNDKEVRERFDEAKRKHAHLQKAAGISSEELEKSQKMISDIDSRFEGEIATADGTMHLLASLREVFREMESVEKHHEWDSLEAELRSEFARLEKANNELGNNYDSQVAELRTRTDRAITSKNLQAARDTLSDIHDVFMSCTLIYQLMAFIQHHSKNFGSFRWKNSAEARAQLNRGVQMIGSGNPDVEDLREVCIAVIDQLDMPESEKVKF